MVLIRRYATGQQFTFYSALPGVDLSLKQGFAQKCRQRSTPGRGIYQEGVSMSNHQTYQPGTVLVLVGTKRGLFLLNSRDREKWNVEAAGLPGHRVYHAILDQRDGRRLFAADHGDFFGVCLRYTDDFRPSSHEPEQCIQFPENSRLKINNIWVIETARPSEPATGYT